MIIDFLTSFDYDTSAIHCVMGREDSMRNSSTKKLVVIALLVAMNIVLSRFLSINAWNIKIGFTFVTVFAAAYLYGPLYGAVTGALGDLVGALMFPIGAYFPGFTLTAALTGILYGILLYRNTDIKRIVPAALVSQAILGFLLNSYWISVLYHADFRALLATRAVQCIVMIIVEIVTMKLLGPTMKYLETKVL